VPRQAGFSLLELLVTLLVIVLATSLVTLNVGSGGRGIDIENRMRDLAAGASYALDEAQFTGNDFGLLLWADDSAGEPVQGFAWRERLEGRWQPPAGGQDIFAGAELPASVELRLELDGIPVAEELLRRGMDAEPQVVLYASGETTPGAVEVQVLESGELLWRLEWDMLGSTRLLLRGLDEEAE
jgi:prepilin-type N-terminal cleavage/methylation domain-containing protein